MKLSDAIKRYKQIKICSAISSNKLEEIGFFNDVDKSVTITNENVEDSFTATLMFSEMAMRKIGNFSPLYAYYFGSICQNKAIEGQAKIDARRFRLISVFMNLNTFERFITLAHDAPIMGYDGNLSDEEFFDFLIMSDAYLVWNSDLESNILKSIQKLVIQHESNYTKFSKQEIIKEGEKAHSALFSSIKFALHL